MTRTITPTHVLLNQVTLAANSTTVTFSNIPQTFGDLVLTVNGLSVSGESYYYSYFNSDTGANYSRVEMFGTGSSTGSGPHSNLIPITLHSSSPSNHILHVMDYSAADKHKSVLYRNNSISSGASVLAGTGRWANTAAINTIRLEGFSTASFAAGCIISLYGVFA